MSAQLYAAHNATKKSYGLFLQVSRDRRSALYDWTSSRPREGPGQQEMITSPRPHPPKRQGEAARCACICLPLVVLLASKPPISIENATTTLCCGLVEVQSEACHAGQGHVHRRAIQCTWALTDSQAEAPVAQCHGGETDTGGRFKPAVSCFGTVELSDTDHDAVLHSMYSSSSMPLPIPISSLPL